MRAVTDGCLADVPVRFSSNAACCVVLASRGYPQHYEKGFPISIPEDCLSSVYVAGGTLKNGRFRKPSHRPMPLPTGFILKTATAAGISAAVHYRR